jgi:hypothetical protein
MIKLKEEKDQKKIEQIELERQRLKEEIERRVREELESEKKKMMDEAQKAIEKRFNMEKVKFLDLLREQKEKMQEDQEKKIDERVGNSAQEDHLMASFSHWSLAFPLVLGIPKNIKQGYGKTKLECEKLLLKCREKGLQHAFTE